MEQRVEEKKCSCGRENVLFHCLKADCPSFTQQKYYCQQCFNDFEKHLHKSETIISVKEIAERDEKWNILNQRCSATYKTAKEKMIPIKHLIAYLEDVSSEKVDLKPLKSIQTDFLQFSKTEKEVSDNFAKIKALSVERNLAEMKKLDGSYDNYHALLPTFDYLKSLTENDIFKMYQSALLHDTQKYFPLDMTSENKELYYRLKFKALNQSMKENKNEISQKQVQIDTNLKKFTDFD